jgi:hypothetical protein
MPTSAERDESKSQRKLWEPPPPDFHDPVIEAYKRDVDRSLLRENLKLTVAERFERFDRFAKFAADVSAAGEQARAAGKPA